MSIQYRVAPGTGRNMRREQLLFSHRLRHVRDRHSVVSGNTWTATGSEVPETAKTGGKRCRKDNGARSGIVPLGDWLCLAQGGKQSTALASTYEGPPSIQSGRTHAIDSPAFCFKLRRFHQLHVEHHLLLPTNTGLAL